MKTALWIRPTTQRAVGLHQPDWAGGAGGLTMASTIIRLAWRAPASPLANNGGLTNAQSDGVAIEAGSNANPPAIRSMAITSPELTCRSALRLPAHSRLADADTTQTVDMGVRGHPTIEDITDKKLRKILRCQALSLIFATAPRADHFGDRNVARR